MTVRRDSSAQLLKVPGGCLTLGFGGHAAFSSGRFSIQVRQSYARLIEAQEHDPIEVAHDPRRERTWWMFEGRFYWEEEGYSADEVKALVLAADRRRERRLEQAIALTSETVAEDSPARAPIPEEVRVEVWRRDGGRCVVCGSQVRLEFDHIIPITMGGSSTARNLQLLCEACNRAKGPALG